MTGPGSFLGEATTQVAAVFADIEVATAAYAEASGIKCRTGCGQCCLKPGVEAMPVEMLPLAAALLANGDADQWYDRAAADPSGICVFYAARPEDPTLGRCTQYDHRPSLCRLFGFAAISTKVDKHPALAACHWHKKLMPATVAAAQAAIDSGGQVPLFSEYALRLGMVAPQPSLSQRLPINQALTQAIEKLSLSDTPQG